MGVVLIVSRLKVLKKKKENKKNVTAARFDSITSSFEGVSTPFSTKSNGKHALDDGYRSHYNHCASIRWTDMMRH